MNTLTVGPFRTTKLSDSLVRIEFSPGGWFDDRRSIRAATRPDPLPWDAIGTSPEGATVLSTPRLRLHLRSDAAGCDDSAVWAEDPVTGRRLWAPSFVDHENLGGVHKSLDRVDRHKIAHGIHPASFRHHRNDDTCGQGMMMFDGKDDEQVPLPDERTKFPPAVLSRSGYFLYNDTPTDMLGADGWIERRDAPAGYLDLYLFIYGEDLLLGLRDYHVLFGRTQLPPRYAFGLWYSSFPTHSEPELRGAIEKFQALAIPLDVLVLDLEWHRNGWHGYDWNTEHFPDPQAFLDHLKANRIHVTLNLHPNRIPVKDSRFSAFLEAAGIPAESIPPGAAETDNFSITDRRQARAFLDVLHRPVQEMGVDFWWQDGGAPGWGPKDYHQFWTNHLFFESQREQFPALRPMIFSRTSGLGSHRYPFHFTGDIHSQWEALRHAVEYTLRAGHMGLSFVTHDTGGFFSAFRFLDPELYVRWVQFAALSPLLRIHSSDGGERRPWLYEPAASEAIIDAVRLRARLLPYLYTLAWESAAHGLPMCRSHPLAFPTWRAGDAIWDAYALGGLLYAVPLTASGPERTVILPPGAWVRGGLELGTSAVITADGSTPLDLRVGPADGPLWFVRAGAVLVTQAAGLQAGTLPPAMALEIVPADAPTSMAWTLYEDDGCSREHESGVSLQTRIEVHTTRDSVNIRLAPEGDSSFLAPRCWRIAPWDTGSWQATVNGEPIPPIPAEPADAPRWETPRIPPGTAWEIALHRPSLPKP